MKLDLEVNHPHAQHLIHLEPFIDAHALHLREQRFIKKANAGRQYSLSEVFTWLDHSTLLKQVAVVVSRIR